MRKRGATRIKTREERIRNRWLVVLAIIAIVLFVLAGGDNHHEENHQMYCDMVALYKATNGEAGWPAYQGTKYCPVE